MLRDKFAMAAMQGILSDRNNLALSYPEETAQKAYRQADAMMKERANWDFSGDPDSEGEHTDGYGYQEERDPGEERIPHGVKVTELPGQREPYPWKDKCDKNADIPPPPPPPPVTNVCGEGLIPRHPSHDTPPKPRPTGGYQPKPSGKDDDIKSPPRKP